MNIILCGMMGSGKTTVGVKLAELTKRRWYDTDSVIEEKHGKISDIFERFGEAHFRLLETQVAQELCQNDGVIISTGGGMVLKDENVEILKQNGKIIFLRAKKETLFSRLQADSTRPLLQNSTDGIASRIQRLLQERTPVYERVANYVLDVDKKSVESIAKEIIDVMQIGEIE